jgi:hypothetical protein
MTRETQKAIRESKQRAAILVQYANPKSKIRPSIELVTEILSANIPYLHGDKPVITTISITKYHKNAIIKSACFRVETTNGKVFEISAYQQLTGRTQKEKEADKTATFPSGLFNIFHSEITPNKTEGKSMDTIKWAIVKIWTGNTTKIGIDQEDCTGSGPWVIESGLTEQEALSKIDKVASELDFEVFNNDVDTFCGYSN